MYFKDILQEGDKKASLLFSGDTLFMGSIGRTDLMGGSFPVLEESIRSQLYTLPDETRVFPGHDYLINNLEFTLDREPDNENAKSMLACWVLRRRLAIAGTGM